MSCNSLHTACEKNCVHLLRAITSAAPPSIFCKAGLALRKWPYMSSVNTPTGIAW